MICQAPQKDNLCENRFSLSVNSSSTNGVTKRHSYHQDIKRVFPMETSSDISANIKCRESGVHSNEQFFKKNEKDDSHIIHHWERIESYYMKRMDSLAKEIESSTVQNTKLTVARDDLLQEILKLHQKSIELNNKNNSLIRSIAEKENQISAFMYHEQQPQQKVDGINSNIDDNTCYGGVVGVTLIDKPYSIPSSSICNTEEEVSIEVNKSPPSNSAKKENNGNTQPGIFRQISLRLSSRKRRQQEDSNNAAPLNISQPITNNNSHIQQNNSAIPHVSSSEPLLHPAAVVASSITPMEYENNSVVFGGDLIRQAKSENSVIPTIVLKCVREIEARGLSSEGLYRKPGTFALIKELQEAFEEKRSPKLSKYQDINVIASILKLYFRELSMPLIPSEFILPSTLSPQERLNKTYALLHNMPIEPYCTIKLLVQHLKRYVPK
ncbi:unnamed protein product [Mucor hiemalis]